MKTKLVPVAKETQRLYSENEMSVYAGYTTLYILMAMVPLLTLVIGLVNLVPTVNLEHFREVLMELLPDIPQVQTLTDMVIANVNRRAGQLAVSVSVLASLWSASNGVAAIQAGLHKLSGVGGSFVKKRGAALLYTLLFILLIPALLIFQVLRGSLRTLVASLGRTLELPELAGAILKIMQYSGLVTLAAMMLVIWLAVRKTDKVILLAFSYVIRLFITLPDILERFHIVTSPWMIQTAKIAVLVIVWVAAVFCRKTFIDSKDAE